MKSQQTWFAVDVSLAPKAVEAIEYALAEAGAGGTEYSTLGKKEIGETVSVTGYFDDAPDLQNVELEIENALIIYNLPPDSVKEISVREVENKDWLAEWKKTWQPTKAGRFIIAPTWSELSEESLKEGEILIRLDPGMAFGTGTHETTRLCLEALQEEDIAEISACCSFLDVGTGTGILAIAYALETFGEARIVACDTDENSIEIARKNAALNHVANNIDFRVGSIEQIDERFEFVCANLTADVILPLLPQLLEKTIFALILSGILREQLSPIENELMKLNVTQWKVRTMGEWVCVIADRQSIPN